MTLGLHGVTRVVAGRTHVHATNLTLERGTMNVLLGPALSGKTLPLQAMPTGTNTPDHPKMAQLWWQNIGDAMSGDQTPQEALDALCAGQEQVLERIKNSGAQGDIGPLMNAEQRPQIWLDAPGAPVSRLENEKPMGETVDYDELIKSWN